MPNLPDLMHPDNQVVKTVPWKHSKRPLERLDVEREALVIQSTTWTVLNHGKDRGDDSLFKMP